MLRTWKLKIGSTARIVQLDWGILTGNVTLQIDGAAPKKWKIKSGGGPTILRAELNEGPLEIVVDRLGRATLWFGGNVVAGWYSPGAAEQVRSRATPIERLHDDRAFLSQWWWIIVPVMLLPLSVVLLSRHFQ